MIECQSGCKLLQLHCNKGREFTTNEFASYLNHYRILQNLSIIHIPQQNEIVDNKNKIVLNKIHSMQIHDMIFDKYYFLNTIKIDSILFDIENLTLSLPNFELLSLFNNFPQASTCSSLSSLHQQTTNLLNRQIMHVDISILNLLITLISTTIEPLFDYLDMQETPDLSNLAFY